MEQGSPNILPNKKMDPNYEHLDYLHHNFDAFLILGLCIHLTLS